MSNHTPPTYPPPPRPMILPPQPNYEPYSTGYPVLQGSPHGRPKQGMSTGLKVALWIAGIVVAVMVIGALADPTPRSEGRSMSSEPATATTPFDDAWPFPGVSRSKMNDILETSFSGVKDSGISEQMFFTLARNDGWSEAQAEYMVKNSGINWRLEAVALAKQLDTDYPSDTVEDHKSMLGMLGHTPEDIDYAANQVWGDK